MKILIVDSHKGTEKPPTNLHFLNAQAIGKHLAKQGHTIHLIWSYPSVNDDIQEGYDVIIFNHSSHYSFVDYAWVEKNPDAKLFTIVNDFNLGESRLAWMAYKRANRKHTVIASVQPNISKIVTKYTDAWHVVNLNALIFSPTMFTESFIAKQGGIYYGSFRKDREEYFKKYLDGMTVSTHSKNREKFLALGIQPNFINRLSWDLAWNKPSFKCVGDFKTSLYIEDKTSHKSYTHLANRFYEAVMYNTVPLFDVNCKETVKQSGYDIPDKYFVEGNEDFAQKTLTPPKDFMRDMNAWKKQAKQEKIETLEKITNLLTNS